MKERAEIRRPTIQAAVDEGGLDAIVEVVCGIVIELKARFNKNSSNSSKPPCSDGLNRPNCNKSLRAKNTERKRGDHPGQALQASENPDLSVNLPLYSCPECGGDLADEPAPF